MKRLMISGACGRMGRLLGQYAGQEGFVVACGIDSSPQAGLAYPVYGRYDDAQMALDLIVDFSSPGALPALLSYATKRKLPLLLGATGYSRQAQESIHHASVEIPIFLSSNMSLGVYVLRQLAAQAARLLPNFDIEIVERHHSMKLDAPSGTALSLLEAVRQPDSRPVYGRHGLDTRHQAGEIGLHALRGGTVAGEHEVGYYGPHESIRLTHVAEDRGVFATGALKAGAWLISQRPGLYGMSDLMNSLSKQG